MYQTTNCSLLIQKLKISFLELLAYQRLSFISFWRKVVTEWVYNNGRRSKTN